MITQNEIEKRISIFLYYHLKKNITASEMLRRCIQREYEDDNFSMRKRIDSPFADSSRFQLHADYNRFDFMYGEFDFFDHIETFAATALPRKDFENVCVAAVYPLPNRIGTNWVRGADGQYTNEGKADHSKGSFSWAILYYNGDLPEMNWKPSPVDDRYPHSHTYETQKAMWNEERSGEREISAYWRDTQLPYDCRIYKERLKKGIPLTEYQQRVVDAGGWPYDKDAASEPLRTETGPEIPSAGVEAGMVSSVAPPASHPSDPYPSQNELANIAQKQKEKDKTPPQQQDIGVVVAPLVAHCVKHRDKWTEAENPRHHERWNHVIGVIESGDMAAAMKYAEQWAEKGWGPWIDLLDKLYPLTQ